MKLKQIIKENNLGELPSDKLFKYNKSTGKFDKPKALQEDTPTANIHPWVARAMQELQDDLKFYLSSKTNTKVDFPLLKSKLIDLQKRINQYHK